ncbi:MAG: response regulator [Phycisphaerales bacterium]|nr:response regulator [Phycisphaerales bacterium]
MRERILVVDGQPDDVRILHTLLNPHYELATAANSRACQDTMKVFGPDLVLLDVCLPDQDGYETCAEIKGQPGGELTQVILLAAAATTADRVRGYAAGADDFLTKPFDRDEMLAKVRVQFRLRHTLLELARTRGQLAKQNSTLEREVRNRTAEVIAVRDVTVFALAKLAESRDPETGEHLERLRAYAQRLAEELTHDSPYAARIHAAFLEDLWRSSPLHDIGKVGVPDVILLKPDRLTEGEFRIMQRHAEIGAAALRSACGHTTGGSFLAMAADIAAAHHEWWDGSGYPRGLMGEDIPLAARIVAVADVYDALTSVRVYKGACDPLVARAMIEAETGTHFDPEIIKAFRRCGDDFQQITARSGSARRAAVPVGAA